MAEQTLLSRAMTNPDDLVVELKYTDSKGKTTSRVVSPIRFLKNGQFLALCLSRCAPRQFQLDRCAELKLSPASHFVMPVPLA